MWEPLLLLAAETPKGTGGGAGGLSTLLIPFALMFGVIYLLMIRPEQNKEKERRKMLAGVKKNDKVLTSGGIYGTVQTVRDKEVVLRIGTANEIKVRFSKSAVVAVLTESEEPEKDETSTK